MADTLLERIERARPLHTPGARNGYHGLTFSWLIGGLVEHATKKRFGDVLREELVEPLELDGCFVGAPPHVLERRAHLLGMKTTRVRPRRAPLRDRILRSAWRAVHSLARTNPEGIQRALLPRGIRAFDWNALETVQACIPAASGMFTSRALGSRRMLERVT